MAKKKRSLLFNLKIFYLIFIPTILLSSFYIYQDAQIQIEALEMKKEKALETQQQLEMERDYLKNKIELLSNPEYLDSYAKKKLLYTSEGELLFIFPEEN